MPRDASCSQGTFLSSGCMLTNVLLFKILCFFLCFLPTNQFFPNPPSPNNVLIPPFLNLPPQISRQYGAKNVCRGCPQLTHHYAERRASDSGCQGQNCFKGNTKFFDSFSSLNSKGNHYSNKCQKVFWGSDLILVKDIY